MGQNVDLTSVRDFEIKFYMNAVNPDDDLHYQWRVRLMGTAKGDGAAKFVQTNTYAGTGQAGDYTEKQCYTYIKNQSNLNTQLAALMKTWYQTAINKDLDT